MLKVNGFKIPDRLVLILNREDSHSPIDLQLFDDLVRPIVGSVIHDLIPDFKFYGLGLIRSETKMLSKWLDSHHKIMALGTPDIDMAPGNLIPASSVLLGDFGYGSDSGIVLDYRDNIEKPRVLIDVWSNKPNFNNRWVLLSQTTDEFLDCLGYP